MADDGGLDVEALAAGYAFRPPSAASLERAARASRRAGLGPGTVAVDVGGGPGHQGGRIAATGSAVVVVDRSATMVAAAAQRAGVSALRGDAAALPLADATCDLVWFQASLHYGGWADMVDEAIRVLRPGALLEAWTFRPEHARASFLAQWFPTVGVVDEERFPDPGAMRDHLCDRGMRRVRLVTVDDLVVRRAGDWRTAVRGGFVSTLQSVPGDELAAGLRRFRAAHPDDDETLRYPLRWAGLSGRTPSLP